MNLSVQRELDVLETLVSVEGMQILEDRQTVFTHFQHAKPFLQTFENILTNCEIAY